jgi:hypothetical protein
VEDCIQGTLDVEKMSPQDDRPPPPFDARPRRRSDMNMRVVERKTVVLDRPGGLIHQFNHTASYIWEQCDGAWTVKQIAHRLVGVFDVDFETAAHDVADVVGQFRKLALLESCEG